MAGGGAALSRVSSRGRLAAPYPTVPYSTVPYCVLPYSRNIRQSISYPVSLKESQGKESRCGKPAKMWKTLWKACGKLVSRRSGRCGRARARRSMGACRQGGCGRGRGFWSGPVWRALSAGAGVVDAFGWRVVAAVRCGTRVQRRARWLTFLPREKMLDKLCKSILNWKQEITQAAAGDGLRHRPHRRSCSVYPTSTSSVAATLVMCCASDARLSGAALRKTETKNSAPHRTDAGRSFVTAAAQARLPFRWLSCAAAFSQPFLCACGHRAAFLTRPSRSCPRAMPRTGCAYGRSGGRTPSSPATTAGRTR